MSQSAFIDDSDVKFYVGQRSWYPHADSKHPGRERKLFSYKGRSLWYHYDKEFGLVSCFGTFDGKPLRYASKRRVLETHMSRCAKKSCQSHDAKTDFQEEICKHTNRSSQDGYNSDTGVGRNSDTGVGRNSNAGVGRNSNAGGGGCNSDADVGHESSNHKKRSFAHRLRRKDTSSSSSTSSSDDSSSDDSSSEDSIEEGSRSARRLFSLS